MNRSEGRERMTALDELGWAEGHLERLRADDQVIVVRRREWEELIELRGVVKRQREALDTIANWLTASDGETMRATARAALYV